MRCKLVLESPCTIYAQICPLFYAITEWFNQYTRGNLSPLYSFVIRGIRPVKGRLIQFRTWFMLRVIFCPVFSAGVHKKCPSVSFNLPDWISLQVLFFFSSSTFVHIGETSVVLRVGVNVNGKAGKVFFTLDQVFMLCGVHQLVADLWPWRIFSMHSAFLLHLKIGLPFPSNLI